VRRVPGSSHYEPVHEDIEANPLCGGIQRCQQLQGIEILRFESPMWFANVSRLTDRVLNDLRRNHMRGLVLDMSSVPRMDTTAANALKKLFAKLNADHVVVAFAGTSHRVRALLTLVCGLEGNVFYSTIYEAQASTKAALELAAPDSPPVLCTSEPRTKTCLASGAQCSPEMKSTQETAAKEPTPLENVTQDGDLEGGRIVVAI